MNIRKMKRVERAEIIAESGSVTEGIHSGKLKQFQDISLSEALVLGLLNQGVRKYVGIFGHGTTDVGEVLRVYQDAGLVEVYNVRNETEASHAASMLRWQYGEHAAVFTSIGPGAMHAFAGSLLPKSNGLGVYYIFGDETTHNEGPNMQQIPIDKQDLFLSMTSIMSGSYSLNTPEAVFTALKRGYSTVCSPLGESPFFFHLPMNIQGKVMENMNLSELPIPAKLSDKIKTSEECCAEAVSLIGKYKKITIKAGGGAREMEPDVLKRFLDLTGAVYVHGPQIPGILPDEDMRNMTVGGSKGSISGNFAMENCELLVVIGARGVCQWDSSGTSWKNTKEIININTRLEDALHYNRSLPLVGNANEILNQLNEALALAGADPEKDAEKKSWLEDCSGKRQEWEAFKGDRFITSHLFDEKWGRELLTQPAVLNEAIDFAMKVDAVKIFDAGDVQANGFQAVKDQRPKRTFTDTGSSYMGFAVSALLASAMTDRPDYPIAFTGDGSFLMNPQILLDAVQYSLRGMILLMDNRRMAAISGLQEAQYGKVFATDDQVEVDYIQLASSFKGVKTFDGGSSLIELRKALKSAYEYKGLSLVYVPVYSGADPLGGLGVFGNWNVGNWCDAVQKEKHRIGL
ncbi:MAG: thiamine pyrophosphate-binding protein [Spirochaetales bacterium]|nr:thiamine pyrophosphate-binding protein [Spirochaetales bacterium]